MTFTSRLRQAFRPATAETRAAAYLNEATSVSDLERREREIDQGRFRARSFPR